MLSLGCGDLRNILYTAYIEQGLRELLDPDIRGGNLIDIQRSEVWTSRFVIMTTKSLVRSYPTTSASTTKPDLDRTQHTFSFAAHR